MAALNTSLQAAFSEAMADPSLTAGGATVFPSTGTLGPTTPTVPPETLVGQEVATFELGPVGDRDRRHRRHGAGLGDRRDAARERRSTRPPARAGFGRDQGRRRRSSSARPSASRSRASAQQVAVLDPAT